jgi:Xaa-Pro aminopeptidase
VVSVNISALQAFISGHDQRSDDYSEIPFGRSEYRARLDKLRAALQEKGVDAVLLTSPEAMCWLHGYSLRWYRASSTRRWPPLTSTAVHVDDGRFIVFDGAEHAEMLRRTSISEDNRFVPRYQREAMLDFVVAELRSEGWLKGNVGLEMYSYVPNPAVNQQVAAAFQAEGARIVDATEIVRSVRRRKSAQEIAYIEEAARICDAGLRHLDENIATGMTEIEAWSTLIAGMAAAGGEPAALHQLVIVELLDVGRTSHAIAGRRVIRPGDRVQVDACGVYNHYHCNISRSYMFGDIPSELIALNTTLWGAHSVLCKTATDGTSVRDVNRALREYYIEAGLWRLRANSWIGGYELGISFPPDWVGDWVFTVAEEEPEGYFEAGMVTNFESSVRVGVFDTFIYGSGDARALSSLPHNIVPIAR